ncbi:MAG TPA: hypothetical protein VMU34_22095 [Mycobacterium sp.]|nr:hypothetical protein [Mycobacterium sp.]
MIIWLIAALLGGATGLRIGWALVNKQSVVSAAMMLALGSLGVVAALNWQPLTLLIDTALHWPNISIALSQVALTLCAAASCVMILAVASTRKPAVTRRLAWTQYGVAAVIGAISLGVFFAGGQRPEMAPHEYLSQNFESHTSLPWLLPLLYALFALAVVSWVGMRYSSPSRRGRALFVFTVGVGLIVLALGFFLLRAIGSTQFVGVEAAITLLGCAMLLVAAGSLLPSIEDWFGARLELRIIDPLLDELGRRQPEVGVGVRPRGPLAFRVAERMSLISDALFLEGTAAARAAISRRHAEHLVEEPAVSPQEQARKIAQWIHDSRPDGNRNTPFPGLGWLRQPETYSDREWILEIARQYRELTHEHHHAPETEPAQLRRMPG